MPLEYAVRGLIVPLSEKCDWFVTSPNQLRPLSRIIVKWLQEISGIETTLSPQIVDIFQVLALGRDGDIVESLNSLLNVHNIFVVHISAISLTSIGDPRGIHGLIDSIKKTLSITISNICINDAFKTIQPQLHALRNFALIESGKIPVIYSSRRKFYASYLIEDLLYPISLSNQINPLIQKSGRETQYICNKVFNYILAISGDDVNFKDIIDDLIGSSTEFPIIRNETGKVNENVPYKLLLFLSQKNMIPLSEEEVLLFNKALHVEIYKATIKSGGPHGVDDGLWAWEDKIILSDGDKALKELCFHKSNDVSVLLNYVTAIPDFTVRLGSSWEKGGHAGSEYEEVHVSMEERRKIARDELLLRAIE